MPNYNPYQYYPTQTNSYPTQMNVNPTQQSVGQIQNGGFISLPSEEMVNTYPVAPGNCVTFKIEGKPIVMEKSMGFSQLESPKIERYRLVKEEVEETPVEEVKTSYMDEIQGRMNTLESEIDKIRGEIDALKPKKTTTKRNGED